MNKKIILIAVCAVIAGCDEQKQYKQAIIKQMQAEKDMNDYGINLEEMADCVDDKSSKGMPGFAPFEPIRKQAYQNYRKMIELKDTSDPKKTLEELRESFGSAKGLADAHSIYSEAVMECVTGIVTGGELNGSTKAKQENKEMVKP